MQIIKNIPGGGKPRHTADPVGIINACRPAAWLNVGGITPAARALHHFHALDLPEVILLHYPEAPVESLGKWQAQARLVPVAAGELPATLAAAAERGERFLYLDASHLCDPRLLEALLAAHGTTACRCERDDKQRLRAGLLLAADLRLWAEQGEAAVAERAATLRPADIDPFDPALRGPLLPYFMEVTSPADARRATRLLLSCQQKQVMDLPAEILHPPLENALTLLLLDTPVSPNAVTLVGALLGALVAWLFWHGQFLAGALLGFFVGVLDGVDGKLARMRLQFSRLGSYEDFIDYLYETSWYIALGFGLHALPGGLHAPAWAAAMVVADTADNIFYTLAGKWYGRSIDLFSPWDGRFRRIAGRRNVYNIMFIVGFAMGWPMATFAAATAWAVITAMVHAARLVAYGRQQARAAGEIQ